MSDESPENDGDPAHESLHVRLQRGAVELDEVIAIARMLAVHLDALHVQGRVDGALCPHRVEIRRDHGPALREPNGDAATHEDGVAHRAYTAPEVWAGGAPTASSDQFALAAILYEALCGGRAFPGERDDEIHSSITSGSRIPLAARVPGLAQAVDAVFERGLAAIASDRYPSCAAFVAALVAGIESSRDADAEVLVRKPSTRPGRSKSGRVPLLLLSDDDEEPTPTPWLKIAVSLILIAIIAGLAAAYSSTR